MTRHLSRLTWIHGVVLGLMTGAAAAQVPGGALPGQIERQLQQAPAPRATGAAPVRIPDAGQQAPANADTIRFVLAGVDVAGATVYSQEVLWSMAADLVGREVTLADVYALAARITARYRNDGYILSQVVVPAQTIEGGVVKLSAVEGRVAEVRVEGADAGLAGDIARIAAPIKDMRPLTAAALERALLLVNELPGLAVRGVLSAAREPGTADLMIDVTPRVASGGASIDNRGSRSLGPRRYQADAEFYTRLGTGTRSGVRAIGSGDREIGLVSLFHDQWLGADGGKLSLGYSMARSRPQEMGIIPLNLETASNTFNLGWIQPFLRSRAQNLTGRVGLAAHNGETKVFGVKDTADRLRSLRTGLTWDRADRLAGVNLVDVEYSHGLSSMGASSNADPFLSRAGGRVDYSKINLYAARQQSFGGGWSGLAAFSAQHAFTRLLSPELFSFGGEQFGRGYDPSELVGDHGMALKLELRYTGALPTSTASSWTAYGFYDVGQVRQRDAAGLAARASAASTGVGLRFALPAQVSLFVEAAKPINRDVAQENNRKSRLYGGLGVRF